jgi:ubiquinone/menaquinone biosynthesis C-methylase UbiE
MKKCPKCSYVFDTQEWKCPHCEYQPNIIDGYISFAPKLAESSPGFDKSYFDILANLESKNFWFRARNRLIIYMIKYYFASAENLLEIGCGTGFVLSGIEKQIPHLNIFGSEIFVHGLSFAQQKLSQCQLFQMDAQVIPFNNEFDIIGAFDVLEHIEDDQLVLSEMYKAVKDNGGIILTVPQHPWLWSKADEYAHHVRRYSSKELIQKVKQSGFKVVRVTSFVSLLLPLMFLSRFLNNTQEPYYFFY